MYFDKQGKPITREEWGKLSEGEEYRVIRQEPVGDYCISTVWFGLSVLTDDSSPLNIFETMVFVEGECLYRCSYSTEQEALDGHMHAVCMARSYPHYLMEV